MMNWRNLARFEKNGPKQRDAWTWYFATMYATVLLGNAFSPGGLLPNYSRHGLVLATHNIGLIKRTGLPSARVVRGGVGSVTVMTLQASSFKAKKPDTEKEDDMTVKAVRESNRRRRRSF